jgi:hypothetical protein
MFTPIRASLLLTVTILSALIITAQNVNAGNGARILRVSPLRIMCFTTPCPPYNAMAISLGTEAPGPHPLYLGPLPALRGAKSAVMRVGRTWRRKDCVILRGKLDHAHKRPVLFVSSIMRAC